MKTTLQLLALMLLSASAVQAEALRLMPLGDSITYGYWSGIGSNPYNSYRKTLKSLLETNGYAVDFVGSLTGGDFTDNQHEGHNAYHAWHPTDPRSMADHVAGWVSTADPDIVLLHIGTNDINGSDTNTHAEVSTILDEIYGASSSATVVLALILNVKDDAPLAAGISAYNSNLNAMAQTRIADGDNLMVVDMENGAGIDYDSADMNDRLHPTPTGYDKMATNWYPAVVQAIRRQQGPQLDHLSAAGNTIGLAVSNLAEGWPVTIERAESLTDPAWTNLTAFLPGSTTTNLLFPTPGTQAFFRVTAP